MRQLLVSAGTNPVYTAGVLGAGQLDVLGINNAGATAHAPLLGGFTQFNDTDKIRFIQGAANGVNVFSPWINGKDIIGWAGQTSTPQTAQNTTVLFAVNAAADGTATLKLISANQGVDYFDRKSVSVNVLAAQAAIGLGGICEAVFFALTGLTVLTLGAQTIVGFPDATVAINAGATTLTFVGTTYNLTLGTELGSFRTASGGLDGTNGTTATVTSVASPSIGSGDAQVLAEYERSLQGDRSFYNRITQPNTPESYVDLTAAYDVYTLRYNNPLQGSIHGVDNVREISIAYVDGGADQVAFETAINTYLASCPGAWSPVNL